MSFTISVIKFERQKELLILWTAGLSKIKIFHIFLLISFCIAIFQIVLSSLINPLLLNKSRSLLSNTEELEINTVLRSNEFNDAFDGLTFYIEKKNINNELINIFIKDESGKFNTIIEEIGKKKNSTIFAKKGFITDDKLILYNGSVQTVNQKNEIFRIIELAMEFFEELF